VAVPGKSTDFSGNGLFCSGTFGYFVSGAAYSNNILIFTEMIIIGSMATE
jgi:hypothetical protein